MNITITENLKTLRKNASKTQENLADFLTISINAVSKWERGECYPDIELLPKIAAFYDVTVDDLLGVGEIRKRERIAEIHKVGNVLLQAKNYKEAIKHYANAFNKFPHDKGIVLRYSMALGLGGDAADAHCAADLCSFIADSFNSSKIQNTAQALLCFISAKLEFDKNNNSSYGITSALEIARNLPHQRESREVITEALENRVTAENVEEYLHLIAVGDDSYFRNNENSPNS
ncbi:MAG: helix-turn-helix domain-containing protein [Oscillospiraceae bacterium]|nr:helix-turn-helix domain-containing protein [Oscillospiraceae bacterium]